MSKIKIYIEFVFGDQPRRLPDHKVCVVNALSEKNASAWLRDQLIILRNLDMLKFINALEVFDGDEQVKSHYFLREGKLDRLIRNTMKDGLIQEAENFYTVFVYHRRD